MPESSTYPHSDRCPDAQPGRIRFPGRSGAFPQGADAPSGLSLRRQPILLE